MDPIIDAFTARYLGVPADEYLHLAGRQNRAGLVRSSQRRSAAGQFLRTATR
ncbi:hypothetical protein ATJ97_2423 [Georgenia soli]|uniref:Uncharacterized protein n=1 Tax=Georgenia soli TaxID=638953 RepID=A0A2A9EM71_9MICO|nr:hypothetical protein [Georgenia soli]PFG39903.1 hypothetical protein ATJ97_2423 [Georgenia soli]